MLNPAKSPAMDASISGPTNSFLFSLPKWSPSTFISEEMWKTTTWEKPQNTQEAIVQQNLPGAINVEKDERNLFTHLLSKTYTRLLPTMSQFIFRILLMKESCFKKLARLEKQRQRHQPPTIQKINSATKNAGLPHAGQAEKRLRRMSAEHCFAKCWTCSKVGAKIMETASHCTLRSAPFCKTYIMTFKATTTVWQRAKDEQKHRRRSTWKNQFRDADIKTIAQWIWKKAQGPAPASVHEHKVAQTDSEATPLIYEFWHNLWKNQHGNQTTSCQEDTANLLAPFFPKKTSSGRSPPFGTCWNKLGVVMAQLVSTAGTATRRVTSELAPFGSHSLVQQ